MSGASRHPKCYAQELGSCSNQISKEHYFSRELLNYIESFGNVTTNGIHWQKGTNVPLEKLFQVKSLCTNHNSSLSDLDTEALLFFKTVRQVGDHLRDNRSTTPAQFRGGFAGSDPVFGFRGAVYDTRVPGTPFAIPPGSVSLGTPVGRVRAASRGRASFPVFGQIWESEKWTLQFIVAALVRMVERLPSWVWQVVSAEKETHARSLDRQLVPRRPMRMARSGPGEGEHLDPGPPGL